MGYSKTHWVNDNPPALNADNLNKMEQGIYDATYGSPDIRYKGARAQADDEFTTLGQVNDLIGGGGGSSTFIGLTDTPNSYSGSGGKYLAVKSDESGVEFVNPPSSGGGSGGGGYDSGYAISVKKTHRNSIIVPFYEYPIDDNDNWTANFQTLLNVIRKYNRWIDFVIIPGIYNEGLSDVDTIWRYALKCIKGAGGIVIGYVATGYGSRSMTEIQNSIDGYMSKYEYIEGFFFDEYSNDYDNKKSFYQQVHDYAKQYNPFLMVGNPGTGQDYRFYEDNLCDVYLIYESEGYPNHQDVYGSLSDGENYGNFDIPFEMKGVIPYGVDLDYDELDAAMENVKYIYFTDNGKSSENDDNPWDSLTTYFDKLAEYMSLRDASILKDRSNGGRYRIYVDGGSLGVEAL